MKLMEEAAEESNKETDSITEVEFEIFSLNQNTADFLTKKQVADLTEEDRSSPCSSNHGGDQKKKKTRTVFRYETHN